LAISVVIVWGALRIVREAVDVLLEAVPAHLDPGEVQRAMEQAEGVSKVHDLHIWSISSGMHLLSAHVIIDSCDLNRSDEILGRLRTILWERFELDHITLQIETPAHCKVLKIH
jgi:cobalt-zinc-cadmium efflux system protein